MVFRFAVSLALRQPRGRRDMTHIYQDLSAALDRLGFSLCVVYRAVLAEIEVVVIITLGHPPCEELKFVVELPGDKQMTFSVDRHQIVDLAEVVETDAQLTCGQARGLR